MSTRLLPPGDWRPVRDAIEKAYAQLGLTQEKTENGSKYCDHDWNLACVIYAIAKEEIKNQHRCQSCQQVELTYDTIIRCLDCRMALCEGCAKDHFGPAHLGRAHLAHPKGH